MTAFSSKLDQWQDHMAAVAQRRLDEIAASELAFERVYNDNETLIEAIRRLDDPQATITECIDSYLDYLQRIAERDEKEL